MSYNSGWFGPINHFFTAIDKAYEAVNKAFEDPSGKIIRIIKDLDYPEDEIRNLSLQVNLNLVRDKDKRPILHMLVEDMEDPLCIKRLRDCNVDFNCQDNSGRSALHYAVRVQKASFISALLELGASPEILDQNRQSPLHDSIYLDDEKSFDLMLPYCQHLNDMDYEGERPIFTAIRNERLTMFNKLLGSGSELESGCDINLCYDSEERTPIEEAVWGNKLELLSIMCKEFVIWDCHRELLHLAVTNCSGLEMLIFLISKGVDPNELNQYDQTPLEFSICVENQGAIDLLSCAEQLDRLNERNKRKCLNAAIMNDDRKTIKSLAKDSFIQEEIKKLKEETDSYFGNRLQQILKKKKRSISHDS